MMRRCLSAACLALTLTLAGCGGGGSSPAAPSSATPTRVIVLGGNLSFGAVTVNSKATGLLTIANTGTATLTVSSITGNCAGTSIVADWHNGTVAPGTTQNVVLTFTPTTVVNCSGLITVNGDQTSGTNTIAITATGTLDGLPIFSQSGVGDNTFTIPSYVTKVRVTGAVSSSCQNFIVRISTQTLSLINVIIGSCSVADTPSPFSGTYAINNGGTVSITSSTGVSWTFTEVRN